MTADGSAGQPQARLSSLRRALLVPLALMLLSMSCTPENGSGSSASPPKRLTVREVQQDLIEEVSAALDFRALAGTFAGFHPASPGVSVDRATQYELAVSSKTTAGAPFCIWYSTEHLPALEVTVFGNQDTLRATEPDDCSPSFSGSGPISWIPSAIPWTAEDNRQWIWGYVGTGAGANPPPSCTAAADVGDLEALKPVLQWDVQGQPPLTPIETYPQGGALPVVYEPVKWQSARSLADRQLWLQLSDTCFIEYRTDHPLP